MKLSLKTYLMCGMVLYLSLTNIGLYAQQVGQQAPSLVLPDVNGNESDLASLRGNYVYLHFWASWCPNSILQLPTVAEMYHHYKDDNFKIYSVSLDASRDAWLNAIEAYQLVWPQHHCDFRGPFSQNLNNYNFIGTPYGFLISPTGTILEVDPDIYDYTNWFKESEKQGTYYTVHLGEFSDLTFIEFDHIEEIDEVESGYDNGSYYVHLGKYANPVEAENAKRAVLNKGYYDAVVVTDSYAGETGLNFIQPSQRNLNDIKIYHNPSPNSIPLPTNPNSSPNQFYPPPYPPSSSFDNDNFSGVISQTTPNETKANYRIASNSTTTSTATSTTTTTSGYADDLFFTPKKERIEGNPQPEPKQFFNKPKDGSADNFAYELPKKIENPNNKYRNFPRDNSTEDSYTSSNPYVTPVDESYNRGNNSGTVPLEPPSLPDSFYDDSDYNQKGGIDGNSSSYSTSNPHDSVYEDDFTGMPYSGEYDATVPQRESKYQRKLRQKKEKAKRKQAKLKREIEATMQELQDIQESLDFSRLYPDN